MAQILRRMDSKGRPRYTVRVRLKGRQATKTFPNRKDADNWARKTEADIDSGRFHKAKGKERTVAEVIDRFLAVTIADYGDSRNMRQRLAWWRKQIGSIPIGELSRSHLADCRDKLATRKNPRNNKRISANTVRAYIAAISTVLTRAVRDYELIEDNPARQVTRPRQGRVEPQFIERREDIDALVAAAGQDSDSMALPLILTVLCTGMRKGELVKLRWQDVDLEQGLVHIPKTKNHNPRSVRLVGTALEAVKAWSKIRLLGDNRVFPPVQHGRDGTSRINKLWARLRKTTEGTDIKFHGTRHTAGTWLSQAGAHPVDVARLLGQKSLAMALVYQHMTDQRRDDLATKLDDAMFGASNENV